MSKITDALANGGFNINDELSVVSPKYFARAVEVAITANDSTQAIANAGQIRWDTLTEYTTSGTRSVSVPSDCDRCFVFFLQGGGGGAAGKKTNVPFLGLTFSSLPGSNGWSGEVKQNVIINVTPGGSLRIVVGSGGGNGSEGSFGNNGGSSSIGSLTAAGGVGGQIRDTLITAYQSRSYLYCFVTEEGSRLYANSAGGSFVYGSNPSSMYYGPPSHNSASGSVRFAFIKKS